MDPATLDRLRKALGEERLSLRARLQEHGADPDDPSSIEVDLDEGFADSAHATAERANELSIVGGLRQNLSDVEHALRKIEAGRGYGTCERCGREIGVERLEAIPSARLCIDCKQQVG